MDLDLQGLSAKFPNHKFEIIEKDLYCDGKRLCRIISEEACKRTWGSNGMAERDKIIEMMIKLAEDSHYYDYDRVQERLRSIAPPR